MKNNEQFAKELKRDGRFCNFRFNFGRPSWDCAEKTILILPNLKEVAFLYGGKCSRRIPFECIEDVYNIILEECEK